MERHVVLKRVLAERSRDQRFAQMFLDEAKLAAQLQHPNIAQVHDIGRLGDSYFYTMEYVHGQDLRNVLRRLEHLRRPFPINLALYIASSALAGLHHAHTRMSSSGKPLGIVHRDVTPSNVMVSYEGAVKVLDFGVAKASERAVETNAGTIKGKIGYLSPEQAKGGATIDRRSDIFAAGIVLHEMLCRKRLFKRDSDFNTMMAIVQEDVAPPSKTRPEVSADLDAIVMKALSKDPAARYQTAAEMADAIEALAEKERHVMTANALGRSMREMFGERPEPWHELGKVAHAETQPAAKAKPVTVTNESVVGGIEVRTTTMLGKDSKDPPVEDELELSHADLEAQLEQAPTLIPHDQDVSVPIRRPDTSTPERSDGTPMPRSQWMRTPPPMPMLDVPLPAPAHVPGQSVQVSAQYPAQMHHTPMPFPLPAYAPHGPAHPPQRRVAIVASVAAAIFGVVVVIGITKGENPPKKAAAVVPEDAAVAMKTVEATPDAAVEATPDAAVDAAVPVVPKTIAEAASASDWARALELCGKGSVKALSRDERVSCGLAACNTKQKKLATQYHGVLGKTDQATVEKACKANDIALATTPTNNTTPSPGGTKTGRDPCKNRQYAERNPLRCQK